jgi:hypothetical protein
VEKEQGEEIARLTVRDAGKLSEITSLHHLLDEAGVELAKAEAEIERLRWRPVSVKPTQEDADGDGLMIQVLFKNGYTQQQLFDSAFSSGATHWRACCPPPAPTAEEVSRAKFNTWYDARCKDPSQHKTALREAMFDSWQAARASKEEKA